MPTFSHVIYRRDGAIKHVAINDDTIKEVVAERFSFRVIALNVGSYQYEDIILITGNLSTVVDAAKILLHDYAVVVA